MLKAVTLTVVLLAGVVGAEPTAPPPSAPPPKASTQPCMEAMKKFCAEVQPGGGRIRQCLRAHQNELSPECRAKLEATPVPQAAPAGPRPLATREATACRDDLGKLCPGVPPGGGRLRDCLIKHDADLSPGCKTALGPPAEPKQPPPTSPPAPAKTPAAPAPKPSAGH